MTDQSSKCLSLNLSSSSSSNPFNMYVPKDLSNVLTGDFRFTDVLKGGQAYHFEKKDFELGV